MFRLKNYIELSGWRPIEMTMGLCRQTSCPCGELLSVACAIVGDNRIDVGVCKSCGYLGYIDRPTPQWFADYYSSDWDDGQNKTDIAELVKQYKEKRYRIHASAIAVLRSLANPGSTVLEVGCGYGMALRNLHDADYQVTGVEPCKHRAEVVREATGLNVIHGNFEDVTGKFNVIVSHHVLEHYYDPAAFIDHAATLQDVNDRLIIAVPPQDGEPTMGVLLFLPHLHSFTPLSLAKILIQRGYRIESAIINPRSGLEIIARKGGGECRLHNFDLSWDSIVKLRRGLRWGELARTHLWWNADSDESGWGCVGGNRPRCIAVEACEQVTDAPCEIRFDGPVRLCVK